VKIKKHLLLLFLFTVVPTALIWLPFFLKIESFWGIPLPQNGMATIVANYDGPLYLVVAKSFYNPEFIRFNYSFPIPLEYYAAHFPLFPLLIKLFAGFAGFPYSMLFVTIASSFVAILYFYKFIKGYVDENNALWISFVFSIFPARFLISRSVGSADPLFMAAILASIYYFRKNKYWLAAIFGVIAQLTKSPGILLFISYLIFILFSGTKNIAFISFKNWLGKLNFKKFYPIFLIPLALISVFFIYQKTLNNFFAYFNSGDNIHLFFPPFSIFNYSSPWIGTSWLEEILLIYLIAGLGLLKLIEKKEALLATFVGVYFLSILFVSHRDLIRYSLPILPFLFAAFSKTITKREFKFIMAILIIPIYLFSLSFISQNVMPISDWAPFL
jgi:Gpi18-like mannosyltransferase